MFTLFKKHKNQASVPWLFRRNKETNCYQCNHTFKKMMDKKRICWDCGNTFCNRCVIRVHDKSFSCVRRKKYCHQCYENLTGKKAVPLQEQGEGPVAIPSVEEDLSVRAPSILEYEVPQEVMDYLQSCGLRISEINRVAFRCQQIAEAGKLEPKLSSCRVQYKAQIPTKNPNETYLTQEMVDTTMFGSTELVLNQESYAVQTCKQMRLDGAIRDMVEREVYLRQNVVHPYCPQYQDAFYHDGSVYVILDLPQFTLQQLVESRAGLIHEKIMAYILRCILEGVQSIHMAEQVHRDIRPDNVYIGLSGEVILGDFGYVHAGKQERIHPFWVAPERIHNAGCDCDMKADIWNIGTLANYMLDGHNPYHNETLVNALMLCSTAPIPKIKNRGIWSQELVRFIRMCHQPKPEDRPTAAELLGTPFIDFVEQMSRAQLAELVQSWQAGE